MFLLSKLLTFSIPNQVCKKSYFCHNKSFITHFKTKLPNCSASWSKIYMLLQISSETTSSMQILQNTYSQILAQASSETFMKSQQTEDCRWNWIIWILPASLLWIALHGKKKTFKRNLARKKSELELNKRKTKKANQFLVKLDVRVWITTKGFALHNVART